MLETAECFRQANFVAAAHGARTASLVVAFALATACGGEAPPTAFAGPPVVSAQIRGQVATVETPFSLDATQGGTSFTDPKGGGLSYSIKFDPSSNGLSANGGRISGTPLEPAVIQVHVAVADAGGDTASQRFPIVAFARGLAVPTLPVTPHMYSDADAPLPMHFRVDDGLIGPAVEKDNSPASNRVTNAGAALGRVLFYDPRLSSNDRVSCASCHRQAFGFSDTARFSRGVAGVTPRHSMGLANARFYQLGRFFWDERAPTLEEQVLRPIQDKVEMAMPLENLVLKLALTPFYTSLFQAAFGSPDVTSERISLSLSQFVRSMVSASSRFDGAFRSDGTFDPTKLTALERQGRELFSGSAGCAACHATNAVVSDAAHNTGLDSTISDPGSIGGRFKAPSLRNIAVRPPFMHDGRFVSLRQVVEFYDSGVQSNPGLDVRLRTGQGAKRLNLTAGQRDAIIAYLETFTDSVFLKAQKFSSPFTPNR